MKYLVEYGNMGLDTASQFNMNVSGSAWSEYDIVVLGDFSTVRVRPTRSLDPYPARLTAY